ncbi:hypothetical protein [Hydrogenimonas sp.]|uniref:hypothetical protein n=1 Tax=Hydrogenimonas sp. TaxID=2231112 RepID=UPI00260E4224|nr:hypothetical protein [Hydrogenimonas sp.]
MLQQLRDIKPPVDVPDDSLWQLLALLLLLLLILSALLYLWKRGPVRRRRRHKDPESIAKEMLRAIDFSDTKKAVYTFDEYLPVLIGDRKELIDAFDALQPKLERYKYKKEVPKLGRDEKRAMQTLIEKAMRYG